MADRLGLELVVTWRPGPFLSASWEDLYTSMLPAPPRGMETRDTLVLKDPVFIDPTDPAIRAADVIELRTCMGVSFRPDIGALSYRFWGAVRPYLLRLTPSPHVHRFVDPVAARFGPHVLGVHARIGGGAIGFNTPNLATQDAFFSEIDLLLSETPDMRVYLAADSADIVAAARTRYGAALIAMDDFLDRDFRTTDSVDDVQVALAEIVLLSRTERLLGTFYSSFGALAGAMGAIPYKELCKPDKAPRWRQFAPGPIEPGD
jgi:hypothetical protein